MWTSHTGHEVYAAYSRRTAEKLVKVAYLRVGSPKVGATKVDGMKRAGNLYEPMCKRAFIEEAARKSLLNVEPWKMAKNGPIQYFLAHKIEMLDKVEEMLNNESYTFGPMHSFTVYEPKERIIHCPPFFPDRILHHCIIAQLAPVVRNNLVRDVYGALEGRGISQCIERVWEFVRGKDDWYFLSFDIRKFYPTIDHDVLKERLAHVVKDKRFLKMCFALIDSHYPGLPLGNGTSVEFSNLYLSIADHYAKEDMRVKYYIRFADNILMLFQSKAEAQQAFADISAKIRELNVEIKNNVRIAPTKYGIDFIGCVFYPTHIRLRKSIKVNMQRTVRKLVKRNVSNEIFKLKTASFLGWCDRCDAKYLLYTTFGEKLKLFKRYMDVPRLSNMRLWFGLPHERYVKIEDLLDQDIVLVEYRFATIRNEVKAVFKFYYPNDEHTMFYGISASNVIKERLTRNSGQGHQPPYIMQFYRQISRDSRPYFGIK